MKKQSQMILIFVFALAATGCGLQDEPECMPGFYQCIDNDKGEGCILQHCVDYKWKYNDTCYNGWNEVNTDAKGGGKCIANCKNNTYTCNSTEPPACILNQCYDEKWSVVGPCNFGWNGDVYNGKCISPCEICRSDDGINKKCDRLLYSEETHKIYTCDNEAGWQIDSSCTNDFMKDSTVMGDKTLFNQYNKVGLYEDDNLYTGSCGECNSDSQPAYLTRPVHLEDENQIVQKILITDDYIYHRCENGQWLVNSVGELSEEKKKEIKDKENSKSIIGCNDAYGTTIYVDQNSNKYHCGSCDNACGMGQSCITRDGKSKCESDIRCDDDGYTSIQIGSRMIRAYCIRSGEDLIAIRDALNDNGIFDKNYDNAYILTDNIEIKPSDDKISDTWKPIGTEEFPFTGIIFGNSKTITLNKELILSKYIGLFGIVKNSHIEHLTIKYAKNVNLNIDSVQNEGDANWDSNGGQIYFGGLSGQIDNSTIDSVQIDLSDIHMTVEKGGLEQIYFGGLAGKIDNLTIDSIQLELPNIQLTIAEDRPEQNAKDGPEQIYYGGLVGSSKHSKFHNIQLNKPLEDVYKLSIDLEKIKKDLTNNASTLQRDFGAQDINIGGIIGSSEEDDISKVSVDTSLDVLNGQLVRIGGAIGYAKKLMIDGVEIRGTVNAENNWNDNKFVSAVGGLIGYAEDAITIRQITSNSLTVNGYLNVGGLIGKLQQNSVSAEISNRSGDNYFDFMNIHVTAALANIGGLFGSIYIEKNITDRISIDGFKLSNVTIEMISDKDLKANDNSGTKEVFSSDYRDIKYKAFKRFIGGIVGKVQISAQDKMLAFSDISLNTYTFEDSSMACDEDSQETAYPFSSNIGGFGGAIANSEFSNIHISNYTYEKSNDDCPTFVSQIGGLVGTDEKCEYEDVNLSNVQILLPVDYEISNIGGMLGSSNSSSITAFEIIDLDLSVARGTLIGGVFGNSIHNTIKNGTVNNVVINSASANMLGLIAGSLSNSSISDIQLSADSDSKTLGINISGDGDDDSKQIGGFTGYATDSNISSCNIKALNLAITGPNITDVGGVVGTSKDSTIASCIISGSSIEIAGNSISHIGGILGETEKETKTSIDRCEVSNSSIHTSCAMDANSAGLVAGLFKSSTITNTKVLNSQITVEESQDSKNAIKGIGVGGFAGESNGSKFESCSLDESEISVIKGELKGIGGLSGDSNSSSYNNFIIKNTNIDAKNASYVGLLAGRATDVRIIGTTSLSGDNTNQRGIVSGTNNVGGIFGYCLGCNINAIREGNAKAPIDILKPNPISIEGITVNGSGSSIGGLVGYATRCSDCISFRIQMSQITADHIMVTNDSNDSGGDTGGLVGYADSLDLASVKLTNSSVSNCANGKHIGTGGMIGHVDGDVYLSGVSLFGNVISASGSDTGTIAGLVAGTTRLEDIIVFDNQIEMHGGDLGGIFGRLDKAAMVTMDRASIFTNLQNDKGNFVGGIIGYITDIARLDIQDVSLFANIDLNDESSSTTGEIVGNYDKTQKDSTVSVSNMYSYIRENDKSIIPLVGTVTSDTTDIGDVVLLEQYYRLDQSSTLPEICDFCVDECRCNVVAMNNVCLNKCESNDVLTRDSLAEPNVCICNGLIESKGDKSFTCTLSEIASINEARSCDKVNDFSPKTGTCLTTSKISLNPQCQNYNLWNRFDCQLSTLFGENYKEYSDRLRVLCEDGICDSGSAQLLLPFEKAPEGCKVIKGQ